LFLTVAYLNIQGQEKKVQIQDFFKYNKIDLAHLQETDICDETFSTCNFISSSFNLISNIAENKYGTSSLVKNELSFENVSCDTAGP
jgi:exonuclease III